MLRRGAVIIVILALALFGFPSVAQAAKCPKGKHWVSSSVVSNGASVSGIYHASSGKCVKNKSGSSGGNGGSSKYVGELCPLDEIETNLACREWLNAGSTLDYPGVARSLVVRLRLPDPTPIFGPDPNNNEWKMLAVGFPVWLTTQGPRHRATSASAQGVTFRLSADLQSTTFALGDGSQVTCTAMTPFTASSKAGSPSPTCGHTYTKPSLPKGSYTVTATANWLIRWSVDGFSGSFPMSYSDSAQLAIGELQALNR